MILISLRSGELTAGERSLINKVISADWWVNPFLNPQVGTVEPAPKVSGMKAYADGVNWDPGSGEGYYYLNQAGNWTAL